MTTTPTTKPAVGKPLAIGYTLTAIAGGLGLNLGGLGLTLAGIVVLAIAAGLLGAVALEVDAHGRTAVAGATLALVTMAALGASFITWAAWPGLAVAVAHGATAILLTVRTPTPEEA